MCPGRAATSKAAEIFTNFSRATGPQGAVTRDPFFFVIFLRFMVQSGGRH